MELGLSNKVAVITGGSQGIGKAAALRLASEGASVVLAARGRERLEQTVAEIIASGGRALAIPADVTSVDDCADLITGAVEAFGRLDILVNNAGTAAVHAFETITDEAWVQDFDLKLFSAIRLVRLAIPHMKQQGGGRIINITNIGAKQPDAGTMPTTVTRAAGLALTKALSRELAPHGILVNTICIGVVRAAQHERRAQQAGVPLESLYEQRARAVPLGRVGEAVEVANAIAFLASDAASFISGTSINLDGGASAVL